MEWPKESTVWIPIGDAAAALGVDQATVFAAVIRLSMKTLGRKIRYIDRSKLGELEREIVQHLLRTRK